MPADASSRARELWESGRRWDDVLQALRDEGQSKTASIRATTEVLRCRSRTPSGSSMAVASGVIDASSTTNCTTR